MKIAYVVPYVPNLIRTRPYNLIHHLAALGNEVTVFTVGSGKQDLKDVEILRSKVKGVYYQEQPVWHSLWNSFATIPSRQPLQAVYSWNPRLAEQLVSLLGVPGTFEIVHVEHLRGSLYGQYVKSKLPHTPVVWDSVDCISYLFEQASGKSQGLFGRFVTRFELPRTRRAEGQLICNFDWALVTSVADKEALLELVSNGKNPSPLSVLPNGVDLDYFHPNPEIQRDVETLVFSGKMSYHANVSMVKYLVAEIMPLIWKERPSVRLVIVGKDPPSDIRKFEKNSLITVTGTVPDIRPYLWQATVSVIPLLYGAGIQNKILEAMAVGTPVITSGRSLSALSVEAGKDLLIANDAAGFAHQILNLLSDIKLQFEIGKAGIDYVRNKHNWRAMAMHLLDIYGQAITATKKSP